MNTYNWFFFTFYKITKIWCPLICNSIFSLNHSLFKSNHYVTSSLLFALAWWLTINDLAPLIVQFCNSGPKTKASLEVVHKHGPCSQLNNHDGKAKSTTPHSEILNQDKERVKYINSRISKNLGQDSSVSELDSVTLPAKSGSLIGSGNYFVVVGLGTPKRDLSLIFDTGSDLTWTQCEPCARSCYKQQDAIFDPSKSTSYSNITCTSTLCTQLSTATGKY